MVMPQPVSPKWQMWQSCRNCVVHTKVSTNQLWLHQKQMTMGHLANVTVVQTPAWLSSALTSLSPLSVFVSLDYCSHRQISAQQTGQWHLHNPLHLLLASWGLRKETTEKAIGENIVSINPWEERDFWQKLAVVSERIFFIWRQHSSLFACSSAYFDDSAAMHPQSQHRPKQKWFLSLSNAAFLCLWSLSPTPKTNKVCSMFSVPSSFGSSKMSLSILQCVATFEFGVFGSAQLIWDFSRLWHSSVVSPFTEARSIIHHIDEFQSICPFTALGGCLDCF